MPKQPRDGIPALVLAVIAQVYQVAQHRTQPWYVDRSALDLVDATDSVDSAIYYAEVSGWLVGAGATGNSGSSYSNGVTFAAFQRHLRNMVQKRIDARDPKARYEVRKGPDPINAMLCRHVHLAPFRFGPDATWPRGIPIANHAKFWMVDDRAFYIGSDNVYPVAREQRLSD
jgi:hypothetical protein